MLSLLSPLLLGMAVTPGVERVVMKFGGSSVRDAERITEVCKLVKDQIDENGLRPHLVCSAMGKTTNNLLAAADEAINDGKVDLSAVRDLHAETAKLLNLEETSEYGEVKELIDECERILEGVSMLGELSPRTRDRVVSYGERMSGRMVAASLTINHDVPATQIESWDLGVLTDSNFGDAQILDACWPTIREKVNEIKPATVGVITGFIGKDVDGAITTLGRGGSDLTASLIGAAAGYDEVQVWKDVDGILSADPRICPDAIPVPRVSFSEAAELAYFGAKVLHPVAMQPAVRADMPVRVKNSYNPTAPGTLITADWTAKGLVSAITSKSGVAMVDITSTRMLGAYGFLATVFESFKKNKLSVDVVATSEVSVSLTLNKGGVQVLNKPDVDGPCDPLSGELCADDIFDEGLKGVFNDLVEVADLQIKENRAIVTLIANVQESSNVMAVVFQVLSALGVRARQHTRIGARKPPLLSLLTPPSPPSLSLSLSCVHTGPGGDDLPGRVEGKHLCRRPR